MVSFDTNTIGYINIFEKVTNASVKDCFIEDESIVFVVQQGEVGKAIGKSGVNVKKVGSLLKKNIIIIEFNPDPVGFVKSMIKPAEAEVSLEENGAILVRTGSAKDKGLIMGRSRSKLEKLQSLVKKYFKLNVEVV